MTPDQLNAAQETISKLQAACDYPRTFASPVVRNLCIESKNLIEQLLVENRRMREALERVIEVCDYPGGDSLPFAIASEALKEDQP